MSAVQHHGLSSPLPLVSLEDISVRLDELDILKQINFTLHEREIVTLIGPNAVSYTHLRAHET